MKAKVSLIVPVYNAEQYLDEALDSAVSQTLRNIEIICVNDGSTDGSSDILKQYQEKDSRITVITTGNHGAGYARNIGLRAAKGEWLAFMDADDMMTPYELEYAVAAAEKNDADVAAFQIYFMNNGEYTHSTDPNNVRVVDPRQMDDLFPKLMGLVTTKVFRHRYIRDINIKFQEIPVRNDAFFCFAACTTANKLVIIDEPLYLYRMRSDSVSHKSIPSLEADYACISGIQSFLVNNGLYEIYEKRFVNWAFRHLVNYAVEYVSADKYAENISEMRESKLAELDFKGHDKDFYDPDNYALLCALEQYYPERTGEVHRIFIDNTLYKERIDQIEKNYIKKCEEFDSILNSTSWKVTGPLRLLLDGIKRFISSI